MAVHVGSRLIFFLSVVSNCFLVLSVVGSIFHSHPPTWVHFLIFFHTEQSIACALMRNKLVDNGLGGL